MTKQEFMNKLEERDWCYMAPVTKEFEEYLADYSDFTGTPGSVKMVKGKIVSTPSNLEFIK